MTGSFFDFTNSLACRRWWRIKMSEDQLSQESTRGLGSSA